MTDHAIPVRSNDRGVSLADQITAKVIETADRASDADKRQVADIVAKAAAQSPGSYVVEKIEYTPGVAALIIQNYNNFNRFWSPEWCNDLARMMTEGDWRPSPAGYGFYRENSDLADGGHRLRGQIMSGTTLVMPTYFSMEKSDAAVIDAGKKRSPADAAQLAGVTDAKAKVTLLTAIWGYEKKAKLMVPISTSNPRAVAREIQKHDALLTRALELGRTSLLNVIDPLLKDTTAGTIVGLFLRHHWPEARVVERLDELQHADFADEKAPLARARAYIEEHRPSENTIKPNDELHMVMKAMLMAESGVTTVNQRREKEIENAIKNPANPEYPAQAYKEAAQ